MLVATAGHIDHGKTALLRVLTGTDTDRLPEERARGISIDLGFAYWHPAGGPTIGFIDVPGHERYVRTMLAGAGGVDLALLVVAADDGVMPQTIEHVAILSLLGIPRALVALTKADRVSPARLAEVERQIGALLAPTPLAGAPVFAVSSLTGDGVDRLAAALIAAREATAARLIPGRHFRLAIDRAFSIAGAGTVVTGTVLAGMLAVSDRLVIAPAGHIGRVRGLHSAGQPVATIGAGERGAINLAGVEVAQIHRGDWLVPPEMLAPTTRMAVWLDLTPGPDRPLRHLARVHVHHGTAAIPAQVRLPRGRAIAPGEGALVDLVLDRPTLAVNGDRLVLRDQSGRQLLGGGTIVDPAGDPFVPGGRRRPARQAVLAALRLKDAAAALPALLEIQGHEIDPVAFAQAFNLVDVAAEQLFAAHDAVRIGAVRSSKAGGPVLPAARIVRVAQKLRDMLAAAHLAHPELGGLTLRDVQARLDESVSAEALAAILRRLIDQGEIEQVGPLMRLPGHKAVFSPAEQAQWHQLEAWLDARGGRPFSPAEAMAELRLGEPATRALLYRRRLTGDVWQLGETRYLGAGQVAWLAARAAGLAGAADPGFTAAQFRDASGIGRNRVIEVLEFFDAIGVTCRVGDARRMTDGYTAIVGEPC